MQVSSHDSSLFFCNAFITSSLSKFIFFFCYPPFFFVSQPELEKLGVGRPVSIADDFLFEGPPLYSLYISMAKLSISMRLPFKIELQT